MKNMFLVHLVTMLVVSCQENSKQEDSSSAAKSGTEASALLESLQEKSWETTEDKKLAISWDALWGDKEKTSKVDKANFQLAITRAPQHGVISVSADKDAAEYMPDLDYVGEDAIQLTVRKSSTSESKQVLLKINIVAVNDQPRASSGKLSLKKTGDQVEFEVLAFDAESKDLRFDIKGNPTHGNVNAFGGNKFEYRHDGSKSLSDSFVLSATDTEGLSVDIPYLVSVGSENIAPKGLAMSMQIDEDSSWRAKMPAIDDDSFTFLFELVGAPSRGRLKSFDVLTGYFEYVPEQNYFGPDQWSYRVSDGMIWSEVAVMKVDVRPVNDPPVLDPNTVWELDEDTPTNLKITASDVEGDAVFVEGFDIPGFNNIGFGQVNYGVKVPTTFLFTPLKDANGSTYASFTLNDQASTSDYRLPIKVRPINDAPEATSLTLNGGKEDTELKFTFFGSDIDSENLTYKVTTQGSKGQVVIADTKYGDAVYIPNKDANGMDEFEYEVSDGALTAKGKYKVNLDEVNDAPVAVDGVLSTSEDTVIAANAKATDIDSAKLVYEVVRKPTKGVVVFTGQDPSYYSYVPNRDANGPDSFSFRASDGSLWSNEATIAVTIKPVNDNPILDSSSCTVSVNEDEAKVIRPKYTDAENDPVKVSIQNFSGYYGTNELSQNADSFTYKPYKDVSNKTETFRITVTDTNAETGTSLSSDQVTCTLQILPVNDPPTATSTSITMANAQVTEFFLYGNDIDRDQLRIKSITNPQRMSATILDAANRLLRLEVPADVSTGSDFFDFVLTDGVADSNTARVTVNFRKNNPPESRPASLTLAEDTVGEMRPEKIDIDNDSTSCEVVEYPVNASQFSFENYCWFKYQGKQNFNGTDSFKYRVFDGVAFSAPSTVSITITPVNDAPVASPLVFEALVNSTIEIDLSKATVTDVDGSGPFSFEVVTQPASGSGTLSGQAPIAYYKAPSTPGTYRFTFVAVEPGPGLKSSPATVTINVRK